MLTLNNSLYFISRHFKQFSVPRVIIAETELYHPAIYGWNLDCIYEIDDQEVYNENGLIIIHKDIIWDIESTLLHEYRHHLQFHIHGYWDDACNNMNIYEQDARLFEVALGKLDEFTDSYQTPRVSKSCMLNPPSKSFLDSLL